MKWDSNESIDLVFSSMVFFFYLRWMVYGNLVFLKCCWSFAPPERRWWMALNSAKTFTEIIWEIDCTELIITQTTLTDIRCNLLNEKQMHELKKKKRNPTAWQWKIHLAFAKKVFFFFFANGICKRAQFCYIPLMNYSQRKSSQSGKCQQILNDAQWQRSNEKSSFQKLTPSNCGQPIHSMQTLYISIRHYNIVHLSWKWALHSGRVEWESAFKITLMKLFDGLCVCRFIWISNFCDACTMCTYTNWLCCSCWCRISQHSMVISMECHWFHSVAHCHFILSG